MAVPTTFRFGAGAFSIGDGATPTEAFTKPCGMTDIELSIEKDFTDASVPDCDNPDAPIWTQQDVTSQSWSMKFEGYLTAESLTFIENATFSSATRNVRFVLKGAGSGGGTPDRRYSGKAHITHSMSASLGEKYKVSVEITGDGPLTSTAVAAV